MGRSLSEQRGGGQFGLQRPAHPDSLMSHKANAELHSGQNMPAVTKGMKTIQLKAGKLAGPL